MFEEAGEVLQEHVDDNFRFEESDFVKPVIENFSSPEFSAPSNIPSVFPVATVKRHGILVLDGSGSMADSYRALIEAANEYIRIVRGNGGLVSVLHFSHNASIIYEQKTRDLTTMEGFDSGGTDFGVALQLAIPVAKRTPPDYECRILFFTDGGARIPTTELEELTRLGIRMDVVGFGRATETTIKALVTCGGTASMGKGMDDVMTIFGNLGGATD
jgi:hypothetical protein